MFNPIFPFSEKKKTPIQVVTARKLVSGSFLQRIEEIAAMQPIRIILREYDLPEHEYNDLAAQCSAICSKYGVSLVPSGFLNTGLPMIHLKLDALRKAPQLARQFKIIGVSVHSREEAVLAESLGANYLMAGHVFQTDCKAGILGRGLDFVKVVCSSVSIPVFPIGGITPQNARAVLKHGGAGISIMSSAMTVHCVRNFFRNFE